MTEDNIRLTVSLTLSEARKLIAYSKQEHRHPREQAHHWIAEKLLELKDIPTDDYPPDPTETPGS